VDPPAADAPIPARLRTAFRKAPATARALRDAIYLGLELRALGFAISPKLMAPLEMVARRHLASQVTDPALRARLTPDTPSAASGSCCPRTTIRPCSGRT